MLILHLALLGLSLPGGGAPVALTGAGIESRAPAWSPDGSRIAFESRCSGSWEIDLLEVASGRVSHLAPSPADDRSPAWSPDGRSIAFVRTGGEATDLHLIELESGEVRRLPAPGAESFPSWAPDGRSIAYSRARGESFELARIVLETLESETLLEPPGRDVWPRWSPDGSRLAFFSRRHGEGDQDEIYLLRPADGELRRLTSWGGHDFCPAWSPDGRALVYVRIQPDGTRSLRIVDDEGRERATLAEGYHRVTEPSWSPAGDRIAYAARSDAETPYRIWVERIDPVD